MDKSQAEAIKLQILERRSYLKSLAPSLMYSKENLYAGMQSRVARQEDKSFKKRIEARDTALKQKLKTLNKYIQVRGVYEEALSTPIISPMSGEIGAQSTPLIIAPTAPEVVLPRALKGTNSNNVRRVKRGIRSRKNRR